MVDAKTEMFNKAKKIGEEVEQGKEQKEKELVAVKNSLEMVRANANLAKMYSDNAEVGSENIGGQSLTLKVHAAGRSTSNVLSDGSEPNDGYFFYQPTGEQFKEVECHILCISRGYYVESLSDKKKALGNNDYNTLIAGIITNDGNPRNFIMYMQGKRLQNMWDFREEVQKYKRAKPLSIPMFAIKVKLTTTKILYEYEPGKKTNIWLVNFNIMRNDDGSPMIVDNEKTFTYLMSQVDSAKKAFEVIIEAKEVEKESKPLPEGSQPEPKTVTVGPQGEVINPSDIPF